MLNAVNAPSILPNENFDAEEDAKKLRKAMRGLGTDEKAIIEVLTRNCNEQRQEIKTKFTTMFGKHLEKELADELGGHFEQVCLGLLVPPRTFDALCIHTAIKDHSKDKTCLIQTLCTRSNDEIEQIKAAYKTIAKESLEGALADGLDGGYFKRLLTGLLQGAREENIEVDPERALKDAQELKEAGPDIVGTDEVVFSAILASRSPIQLLEVFDKYQELTGQNIEDMIRSETSGALRDGYLPIIQVCRDPYSYFARCLNETMDGPGTADDALIRIIISRSEVDLGDIRAAYKNLFDTTLADAVADDTSGDYRKILLAIIGKESDAEA